MTAASGESIAESDLVFDPPETPAIESLRPAHRIPHGREVGVAGLDAAAYEGATRRHRGVEDLDQLTPLGRVESEGIGDQSQPCWAVGGCPPELGRVDVVVDGNAHPGELGQVIDRPAGSAKVEVEK